MGYISEINKYPVYTHTDLGVTSGVNFTRFKLWSPMARYARMHLYDHDHKAQPIFSYPMQAEDDGCWAVQIPRNLENHFYTFQIYYRDKWLPEAVDPYAKAVGVNGKRGMVVDLGATNPTGWEDDKGPIVKHRTDIIIYEVHIRDWSIHPQSGIQHKGKFSGFIEPGTKNPDGHPTGFDHLKSLGITHIQLLPVFDFISLDETIDPNPMYNWGYETKNYQVPEGSYATNPYNGLIRIKEFKELVKACHDQGLGIILDVAFNHTCDLDHANFQHLTPGYFYRHLPEGDLSNGSKCGNDTASERPMMRKFMLETLVHWVSEYHIDGFRFDLMGLHDIETMNTISKSLKSLNPTLILLGEGWSAGPCHLPEEKMALKTNITHMPDYAVFCDEFRDGVKGHYHQIKQPGFVGGAEKQIDTLKFGIAGGMKMEGINYQFVNYSLKPYAANPGQIVHYVSCHDDHTLFDKISLTHPDEPKEEIIKMHLLSITLLLTAQGIPLLHAGVEILRTKKGDSNSFQSADNINAIDWPVKSKHIDVLTYIQQLLKLRKLHPAFRMPTGDMIRRHLHWLDFPSETLFGFSISGNANGDDWGKIIAVFNGHKNPQPVPLPMGKYQKIIFNQRINLEGLGEIEIPEITIEGRSALLMRSL